MNQLLSFIKKELLILSRDLHGLLLLFIMPTIFILIMTFALQNQYGNDNDIHIDYYLVNLDGGKLSQKLTALIKQSGDFQPLTMLSNEQTMRSNVASDKAKFLIIINDDFKQRLKDVKTAVQLESAPSTAPAVVKLMESKLISGLSRLYMQLKLLELSPGSYENLDNDEELASNEAERSIDSLNSYDLIQSKSLYNGSKTRPSSVQQNVPAWLLFAMFFIAIPISTTSIGERQQGTLNRLHSIGVEPLTMILGKMIPYSMINLLQVILMLLVGLYLVPALGGERLQLGNSFAGLAVISICVSLAAVSFGLFVAQLAKTTEQATIFSGIANILMAAVGGVMVPRFVMPQVMQDASIISPMAWGLDGFLDILLRNGTVLDVLPEAGSLLLFALVLLIFSISLSRQHLNRKL